MASDETSKNGDGPLKGLRRFLRRNVDAVVEATLPADEAASALVDSAEAFKLLRVGDIATPRADVVAVEIETPFEELLAQFLEAEHSRMPIYRETLDDPVGFVHVKDVFKMVADQGRRPDPDEKVLGRLRREMLYAPPSMPASAETRPPTVSISSSRSSGVSASPTTPSRSSREARASAS